MLTLGRGSPVDVKATRSQSPAQQHCNNVVPQGSNLKTCIDHYIKEVSETLNEPRNEKGGGKLGFESAARLPASIRTKTVTTTNKQRGSEQWYGRSQSLREGLINGLSSSLSPSKRHHQTSNRYNTSSLAKKQCRKVAPYRMAVSPGLCWAHSSEHYCWYTSSV